MRRGKGTRSDYVYLTKGDAYPKGKRAAARSSTHHNHEGPTTMSSSSIRNIPLPGSLINAALDYDLRHPVEDGPTKFHNARRYGQPKLPCIRCGEPRVLRALSDAGRCINAKQCNKISRENERV